MIKFWKSKTVFGMVVGVIAFSACEGKFNMQSVSEAKLSCDVVFTVLGTGQDAGIPQIGVEDDPAWTDKIKSLTATSVAVVDKASRERYLFEATPDIRDQLQRLDSISLRGSESLGLSGIFITHAHIGHYAGLMFLGREAAGTHNVPVFVMPRLRGYLAQNGPWSQLVSLGNIDLKPLYDGSTHKLSDRLSVTPYTVPHRDEFSETIGFVITGPTKSVLFLPDIDGWAELEARKGKSIEDMVTQVDYAYLDATFYDDLELPGRDMSKIPHPRVTESMARFEAIGVQNKIRFIHINHTNQIRFPNSQESQGVRARGFHVAQEDEQICLSD